MPADPIRRSREHKKRGTYLTPTETIVNIATMNKEAILGIIRHVLTTAGGALAANGTVSSEELQTGAGAIAFLIGIIWSVASKKKAA